MTTLNPIGNSLKEARTNSGLSLGRAIVRLSHVVPEPWQIMATSLARIESGHIAHPDPVTIAGLCQVYDVPMETIDPEGAAALKAAENGILRSFRRGTRVTTSTTWENASGSWANGSPLVAA